jgi:cation diffusion facilitator family transporter
MTLQSVRSHQPDPERRRLYTRAIAIAIGGNVLLAVAKGAAALSVDSSAILSDAANSFSDTLYSVMMAVGLLLSQRPADESHPQGHSRFEPLVAVFIALAMGAAGVGALRAAGSRMIAGAMAVIPGWPMGVLVGCVLVKVVMYLLVGRIGRLAHSPAILASARDNLADVLTSTAALVGIWGSRVIHPLFDPAAGLVVALWIFRTAWDILTENLGYLTGRSASADLCARIVVVASAVPGVLAVHQVVADYVGPQVRVDMHIDVDGEMTIREAHSIADQVQMEVEALQAVDLAFVHVEPIGT